MLGFLLVEPDLAVFPTQFLLDSLLVERELTNPPMLVLFLRSVYGRSGVENALVARLLDDLVSGASECKTGFIRRRPVDGPKPPRCLGAGECDPISQRDGLGTGGFSKPPLSSFGVAVLEQALEYTPDACRCFTAAALIWFLKQAVVYGN